MDCTLSPGKYLNHINTFCAFCTFFLTFFHCLLPYCLSRYCQEKKNIWLAIFLVSKLERVRVTPDITNSLKILSFLSFAPSDPFLWVTSETHPTVMFLFDLLNYLNLNPVNHYRTRSILFFVTLASHIYSSHPREKKLF